MDFYSKYDLNTSRTILYRNPKCKNRKKTSSLESDQLSQAEFRPAVISTTNSLNEQSRKVGVANESHPCIIKAAVPLNLQKTRGGTKHPSTVAFNVASIKTYDYREEPTKESTCRPRCYQSSDLVDRVRSLLNEMEVIKKRALPSGKCIFCKKTTTTSGNCKRCDFLANRYKISHNSGEDDRVEKFEIWLCKVKRFLYMVLQREECKYQKSFSRISASNELVSLLQKLESPLTVREPVIGSLEDITESKNILEQVLERLTSPELKCEIEETPLGEISPQNIETSSAKEKGIKEDGMTTKRKSMISKESIKTKEKSKVDKISKEDTKSKESRKAKGDHKSPEKGKESKVDKEIVDAKKGLQTPSKKGTQKSELALIRQLMKLNEKKKEHATDKKKSPPPNIIKIASLPKIIRKVRKIRKDVIVSSDSFVECDRSDYDVSEMVKGDIIVPIESREMMDTGSVEPMLFKEHFECSSMSQPDTSKSSSPFETDKKKPQNVIIGKGAIRYALSDREFIKKGWTLLPTTKIMRRMNIYKMVPTHPQLDWFERHKEQRLVLYDTGEKFAEIQQDGCGKWFYKDGVVALDYYCSKDSDAGHRYIVYSSSEDIDAGWRLPVTILATFDHRGNGVVYDHYGNERLKYNQTEGIVIDEKIGPAAKWKWHNLNDPPVLQKVFVENRFRPTGCMGALIKNEIVDGPVRKHNEELNQAMLQIELENYTKEKADKLLKEFKPFHIKMKALKLNDHFSLKVLDQANIYLMFRNGHTYAKLSLGMLLISNEIVDTHTAEVTKVETPYDRHPPKSRSIADIQEAIEKARKLGKARGKLRT